MQIPALLLALCLHLLPNPTHSTLQPICLPTADVVSSSPVLDSDGDEVEAGGYYYIISGRVGLPYGGVRLAELDETPGCDVIVGSSSDKGDPVMITPKDPNATAVLQSAYQAFKFRTVPLLACVNDTYWVTQYESCYCVKAGDFASYEFKIEVVSASSYFYKITNCPYEASDECYDVSIHQESSGVSRLFLGSSAFIVKFQKLQ